MKTISETYSNGSQSINYKGVFEYSGHKLKVLVKRDCYDKQSRGNVSIWNKENLQWNGVDNIPFARLQVNVSNVFYQRKVDEQGNGLNGTEEWAFEKDRETLLQLAKDVLD